MIFTSTEACSKMNQTRTLSLIFTCQKGTTLTQSVSKGTRSKDLSINWKIIWMQTLTTEIANLLREWTWQVIPLLLWGTKAIWGWIRVQTIILKVQWHHKTQIIQTIRTTKVNNKLHSWGVTLMDFHWIIEVLPEIITRGITRRLPPSSTQWIITCRWVAMECPWKTKIKTTEAIIIKIIIMSIPSSRCNRSQLIKGVRTSSRGRGCWTIKLIIQWTSKLNPSPGTIIIVRQQTILHLLLETRDQEDHLQYSKRISIIKTLVTKIFTMSRIIIIKLGYQPQELRKNFLP